MLLYGALANGAKDKGHSTATNTSWWMVADASAQVVRQSGGRVAGLQMTQDLQGVFDPRQGTGQDHG